MLSRISMELIHDDERIYCIVKNTTHKEIYRGCVSPKLTVAIPSNPLDEQHYYHTYNRGNGIGVVEGADYDYLYWKMIRDAKTIFQKECDILVGVKDLPEFLDEMEESVM